MNQQKITLYELFLLILKLSSKFLVVSMVFRLIILFMIYASAYLTTKTLSSYTTSSDNDSGFVYISLFLLIFMQIVGDVLQNYVNVCGFTEIELVVRFCGAMAYRKVSSF